MPNTNVFRGSDATLVLAVDDKESEEGKLADELIGTYDLASVVGRLQHVRVQVSNDVRPYHELGRRFACRPVSGAGSKSPRASPRTYARDGGGYQGACAAHVAASRVDKLSGRGRGDHRRQADHPVVGISHRPQSACPVSHG